VDTRESLPTKRVWRLLEEDYKDLSVEICALKIADYENLYMLLEFKTISDFVSSFTEKIYRTDGTRYHRLESQIDRMLNSDKPYKFLMIYGNLEDLHSGINHNSVRGIIASIMARGINVIWLPKGENYPDMIYRLHRKTMKYGKIKSEFKVPIIESSVEMEAEKVQ
jgi:ERCC4-type nuclease